MTKSLSELKDAAIAGDFEKFKKIAEKTNFEGKTPNLDQYDGEGNHLIHLAVLGKNLKIVTYLKERGIDLDIKRRKSEDSKLQSPHKEFPEKTPLHLAVYYRNLEMVKCLVDNGADINAEYEDTWNNKYGGTSLHIAANEGFTEILKYLVDIGADVNIKNKIGESPLHCACEMGDLYAARYLVEGGADINAKRNSTTGYDDTPLTITARIMSSVLTPKNYQGHELTKYLVENRADINAKDKGGNTVLHILHNKPGNETTAKYLIENGGDINIKNNAGHSPLLIMVSEQANQASLEHLEYLIKMGADVNSKGDLEKLDEGIDDEFDLEDTPNFDNKLKTSWTPLHATVGCGRTDLSKLLVENGADTKAKFEDSDGTTFTPLEFAAKQEYASDWKILKGSPNQEIIKYLLKFEEDPNKYQDQYPNIVRNEKVKRQVEVLKKEEENIEI